MQQQAPVIELRLGTGLILAGERIYHSTVVLRLSLLASLLVLQENQKVTVTAIK